MWTLEQKQLYFKEHVPEDQRQEFQGYIEDEVGNSDIENWSNDFIVRVVNRFKQKKQEESGGHETSFYQYQANPQPQPTTSLDNILGSLEHQTQPVSHPSPPPKEEKKQSAFALLDSIFKKKQQQSPAVEHHVDHHNFKTGPVNIKHEKEEPNSNAFASNQFWDTGSKGHKMTKATADFASFDFWSQPSSAASSPQSSKITNFDVISEHSFKKKEQKPQKSKEQLPSFDQLLVNYNKQKGPSPYTKKSNPDQVQIQKKEEKKQQKTSKKKEERLKSTPTKQIGRGVSKSKPGKVLYDGEIVIKNEFQSSVKCFPATERDRLKNPDLRAVIEGHQIIQRTFLMPDYAMYHIRVLPLNILIKRNYDDFSRLKSTLEKLFPASKLAYLEANSWFSKTNADFIANQKVMLEFFLNDLILNPEIRNSRIFQDFLTLPDHKKIKRRFEEWEKLQAPKGIEDLCLLGGKVDVTLSQQQRLYHDNFKRYNTKMIDFLDRQQRLTQTLLQQYRQLDFTQNQLVNLMKNMIDETVYFNERVYDLELQKMGETLKSIHKCLAQENKITKFNIDTIGEMILPFVKYEKENLSEMETLIQLEQSFFKSYLKRSTIERTEEGIPYTSDKVKAYKEGVLKESSNILVFKYQTGFLSNQLCQEGYRVIETLGEKYFRLYRDYSLKCKNKCALMLQYWTSQCGSGA